MRRGPLDTPSGWPDINCPQCGKSCHYPTESEVGGLSVRGHYCSVRCKVDYIGEKFPENLLKELNIKLPNKDEV